MDHIAGQREKVRMMEHISLGGTIAHKQNGAYPHTFTRP